MINKLRSYPNPNVVSLAKDIVKSWKDKIEENKKKRKRANEESTASVKKEDEGKDVKRVKGEGKSVGSHLPSHRFSMISIQRASLQDELLQYQEMPSRFVAEITTKWFKADIQPRQLHRPLRQQKPNQSLKKKKRQPPPRQRKRTLHRQDPH